MASAIFGHAFGVAVAFVTYDLVKTWFLPDDDEKSMSVHTRRLIIFGTAFLSGVFAFFIMWLLFGLGYQNQ